MDRNKGSNSQDSSYYGEKSSRKKVNRDGEEEDVAKKPTRRSSRLMGNSSTPNYKDNISASWSETESDEESLSDPTTMDSANSSAVYSSIALSVAREKLQSESIPERFTDYLNSLDDTLSPPPKELRISPKEARKKLSEILGMDLRAILSSKDVVSDILLLSSTIERDPNLQVAENSVLKFIQEIPVGVEYFEETKKVITDSENFFSDLTAKIALATNLKNEYSESKEKAAMIQERFSSASLVLDYTDNELSVYNT